MLLDLSGSRQEVVPLDLCPSVDCSKADAWETGVGGKEIRFIEGIPEKREGPIPQTKTPQVPEGFRGGTEDAGNVGQKAGAERGHRGLFSVLLFQNILEKIIDFRLLGQSPQFFR